MNQPTRGGNRSRRRGGAGRTPPQGRTAQSGTHTAQGDQPQPGKAQSRQSQGSSQARAAQPRGRGRSADRGVQNNAPRRQRPAAEGEFAQPDTRTPGLPAAEAFTDLDLPASIQRTLQEQDVHTPFPIQAVTLPDSLAGRDVLGRGRTGSGKTLAFGLALLTRTAGQRAEPGRPLGLVLAPTRELAHQISEALAPYARALKLRHTTVVGGLSIGRQASALRSGVEILVATPGRLKDLVDRGDCRLDRVALTVLDEADQMSDMGFLPQVTRVLDQVRPDGQRLLFSATLDRNVDRLVRRYLDDPVVHSVDPSAGAVTTMDHHLLHVSNEEKQDVTAQIAARDGRVILFLHTKRTADRLAKRLLASGVPAAALHGGRSQAQRNRTLDQFKDGRITALVATNVAARGIDIADLDLVVNVDPPADHKDYLHRAGRTARAGASGSVVTLVLPEQRREMNQLMKAARITPETAEGRSGGSELVRITGARFPSGVPLTLTTQPDPSGRSGGSGGSGRGGGNGRGNGGGRSSGNGRGSGNGRNGRAKRAAGEPVQQPGSGAPASRRRGRSSRGRRRSTVRDAA